MGSAVWEDREIKFDVPNVQKSLRNGEKLLSILDQIEDTKGNAGDTGKLIVTNLRLIWFSLVHRRFNLSIGYSRIITMTTKTITSKALRTHQALYAVAAGESMRFEFLFTDLSMKSWKVSPFTPIFDVYRLYQETYLYRDVKLRGAIIQSGQLNILPQEKVFNIITGVWNLSSDQGNLGSFIITNIRLVWFADVNESFNISLPYMQMQYIKVRESRYGPALVIQTTEIGGGYILGFRIDPPDRLNNVHQELKSLYAVYGETPNFGINYNPTGRDPELGDETKDVDNDGRTDEDREINSKLNLYLAEGTSSTKMREPFYCKELGFAMEKIRDGYKLSDLWQVVTTAYENKTN